MVHQRFHGERRDVSPQAVSSTFFVFSEALTVWTLWTFVKVARLSFHYFMQLHVLLGHKDQISRREDSNAYCRIMNTYLSKPGQVFQTENLCRACAESFKSSHYSGWLQWSAPDKMSTASQSDEGQNLSYVLPRSEVLIDDKSSQIK